MQLTIILIWTSISRNTSGVQRKMVVCLCRNITDSQIKEAVCGGASCLREVNMCFGDPVKCGKCGPYTKEIIRDTLKSLEAS